MLVVAIAASVSSGDSGSGSFVNVRRGPMSLAAG